MPSLKDDLLADQAGRHNVAQFVSFSPGSSPSLRHIWMRGPRPLEGAIEPLLGALQDSVGSVNVRTFTETATKGQPFDYGLTRIDDVVALVRRRAAEGYYTIVNETIDVHDGGVSGVALGGVVEFAPDDTPRAVEGTGAAIMPCDMAIEVLRTVYGVSVDVGSDPERRVEFSVHPKPVGYRREPVILWESERIDPVRLEGRLAWPNKFSRLVGDKAFGLLIGHVLGLPVPTSNVIGRRVAPFTFGLDTGAADHWLRTCPPVAQPGRFPTTHGWVDPFRLMQEADPTGQDIASVIAQQAVPAGYSGATLPGSDNAYVEGVQGDGDAFMLGDQGPQLLPREVVAAVDELVARAAERLGPVRIEWAHDGRQAWLLQLHLAREHVESTVLNPGEAGRWLPYDPSIGLEALRDLAAHAVAVGAGVIVAGPIGITSHVGDILRTAGVPARIATSR